MIDLFFRLGAETIIVRIDGSHIVFSRAGENKMAPIDGLKIDYGGVLRQFPELKDDPNWRNKAIVRFKQHIRGLIDENSRARYIIEDLKLHGYIPQAMQRTGFRPVRL